MVLDFLDDYKSKKLTSYLKSQRTGSKMGDKSPIYTLTGNTHDSMIKEADGDFIVVYCNDKAQQCRSLKNEVSLVSQRIRKLDKVFLANFNTEFNELPDKSFARVPQILLYPDAKKNEPIAYEGVFKGNNILEWLLEVSPVVGKSDDVKGVVEKQKEKKQRDQDRVDQRKQRQEERRRRTEL